ncbi:hypothetical protein SARC_05998 [Sphaeroforma arctica JP610]|uniref:Uncharacterized protein n=1 Tax=Sphaeroforma arctica JP610 TaxID=667725 RepID=A0A0L0G0F5_9EUKA|nr:hypothetical protein SARC_05998 [Sphaeroforma arctica JP610]KNC81688.1 hypothetical protein SARC_05998 [Sphaeroforma arctica JP610]|eukprot:XP_014155590.1 hypothetical protein SARC_05998 [Sphaeroforma arctica JP610]
MFNFMTLEACLAIFLCAVGMSIVYMIRARGGRKQLSVTWQSILPKTASGAVAQLPAKFFDDQSCVLQIEEKMVHVTIKYEDAVSELRLLREADTKKLQRMNAELEETKLKYKSAYDEGMAKREEVQMAKIKLSDYMAEKDKYLQDLVEEGERQLGINDQLRGKAKMYGIEV